MVSVDIGNYSGNGGCQVISRIVETLMIPPFNGVPHVLVKEISRSGKVDGNIFGRQLCRLGTI